MTIFNSIILLFYASMVQANAIKHSNTDLDWFAATPEQVESAPCKKDAITLEKVNRAITLQIKKAPQVDREIEGLWLVQQNSTMLDHLYDLLVPKKDFDKKKIDDSDVRRAVNGGCGDIFCVLDTVFGYPQGRYIFYLKYKYGFNASHVAFNNSVVPTEEELQAMIDGVSLYPDYIFPLILDQNKQMTKYTSLDTGSTYANSSITFYDAWSNLSNSMKKYTVFHEVAHFFAGSYLSLQESWKDDYYPCDSDENSSACYTSLYAKTNSNEDLAESIVAYRLNSRQFEKTLPQKYQFLKEIVFRDKEYLDEDLCQSEPYEENVFNELENKIDHIKNTKVDFKLNICPHTLMHYILDKDSVNNSAFQQQLFYCYSLKLFSTFVQNDFSENNSQKINAFLTTNSLNLLVQGFFSETSILLQVKEKFHDWSNSLTRKIDETIKLTLWENSINEMKFYFSENKRSSSKPPYAPEAFCSIWTNHSDQEHLGYQLFQKSVKAFLNDDDIIFRDRYKENLSLIPYNMCLYIFEQRGNNNNWDTFSSKELEDAWENRSLSL